MELKRNSNFEILRIISMYLIVVSHFVVHGMTPVNSTSGIKHAVMLALQSGGKIGVDVFVMIGAYFLIGKDFKFRRPIKLILIVALYFWVIFGILTITGHHLDYQWYELLFPVPGTYWFAGSYIVLQFASPVLNLIIENLSRKKLLKLLIFLTLIWTLIPTFVIPNVVDLWLSHSELGNSTVALFCYLYLLIGYVKKYPNQWTDQLKYSALIFMGGVGGMVVTFLATKGIKMLGMNGESLAPYVDHLLDANSTFVILISFGLFLIFKNLKPSVSRAINTISTSTFAVYLIHDNKFLSGMLWHKVDNTQFQSSLSFLIHGLWISLLIFSSCILIDLLRRVILEKYTNQLSIRLGNKLDKYFD